MQPTSLTAYTQIQPKLPKSRAQIYTEIQTHTNWNRINQKWAQGITNMEISFLLGWSINRVTGRTNELAKAGYVLESQKRPCRITGFEAVAWKAKT